MFIIQYKDSKGNIVTDKTNRFEIFNNICNIINKYKYKLVYATSSFGKEDKYYV